METGMRTDDRWEKWAPISGIVFVLVVLAVFFLIPEAPEDADSAQLTTFYDEKGWQLTILPFFLGAIGGISLIWFAGSLRNALVQAEPRPGRLSAVAMAGGVASAILFLTSASIFIAAPASVEFGEGFTLNADTAELVEAAGFGTFLYFLVAGAVMIIAASLVALRTKLWPAWWSWVGFVFALALLLNVLYFFGFLLYLLWILVTSILLIRGVGVAARPAMGM
jgi:hypothetical protein